MREWLGHWGVEIESATEGRKANQDIKSETSRYEALNSRSESEQDIKGETTVEWVLGLVNKEIPLLLCSGIRTLLFVFRCPIFLELDSSDER